MICQVIIFGFMWLHWDVIKEKFENFAQKSGFEAVLDFQLICFTKYAHWNLITIIYPIKRPNWYHWGSFWKLKKPLVGLLIKLFRKSRLKIAKINYFFNEIQLSLNHIQSKIFEFLGVDNQTVRSCGDDEPRRSPKKAYFSWEIGIYLMSFFYDHPVEYHNIRLCQK